MTERFANPIAKGQTDAGAALITAVVAASAIGAVILAWAIYLLSGGDGFNSPPWFAFLTGTTALFAVATIAMAIVSILLRFVRRESGLFYMLAGVLMFALQKFLATPFQTPSAETIVIGAAVGQFFWQVTSLRE